MSNSSDKVFDPKVWILMFAIGVPVIAGASIFGYLALSGAGDSTPRIQTTQMESDPIDAGAMEKSAQPLERRMMRAIEASAPGGGMPMEFRSPEPEPRRAYRLNLNLGSSNVAKLHITAFDIDSQDEATMYLNGEPIDFPTGLFADGQIRSDWVPLDPGLLVEGDNKIEFEIAEGDASDGFRIDEVRIELAEESFDFGGMAAAGGAEREALLKKAMEQMKGQYENSGDMQIYNLGEGKTGVYVMKSGGSGDYLKSMDFEAMGIRPEDWTYDAVTGIKSVDKTENGRTIRMRIGPGGGTTDVTVDVTRRPTRTPPPK